MKSFHREEELAEEVDKVKAEITGLEQLVTIFTITSSVSTNPSVSTRLGQLHIMLARKKEKLQHMVSPRY